MAAFECLDAFVPMCIDSHLEKIVFWTWEKINTFRSLGRNEGFFTPRQFFSVLDIHFLTRTGGFAWFSWGNGCLELKKIVSCEKSPLFVLRTKYIYLSSRPENHLFSVCAESATQSHFCAERGRSDSFHTAKSFFSHVTCEKNIFHTSRVKRMTSSGARPL